MTEPIARIADERSALDKAAWRLVGPPLYYCADCLRSVTVDTVGGEHTVTRHCEHTGDIIAPRKAVLVGVGGAVPFVVRAQTWLNQTKSHLTGRT